MQTYKAFLKIALKNYPSVLIYFVIFAIISVLSTSQGKKEAETRYKDQEISFTVFNRDGSELGEAVKDYLDVQNVFVDVEDDEEAIRLALYYRNIYYALIIPEGFQETIAAGGDMELMNYKVTDTSVGYYMDNYVESYMQVLKSFIAAGYDVNMAAAKASEVLADSVKVSLVSDVATEGINGNPISSGLISDSKPAFYYFYQYIPYIFLAIIITGMGPILVTFGAKDVRKRINVSAQTFKSYGFQMFLGIITFGGVVLAVFNLLAIILYGGSASPVQIICYIILTSCFALVCLGITYMSGFLFEKTDSVGLVSNVVSLGFSFLGGVFVPLELLGSTIKNIAGFTPTYWYIQENDVILGVEKWSDLNVGEFAKDCGILIMFALAFFCIGLAVLRYKRED